MAGPAWRNKMPKLYVGNLAFQVEDEALLQLFKANGVQVTTAKVIRDSATGQSRGFAFVELEPAESVEKVIAQMNGQTMNGRTLQVNEARPKPQHGSGGGRDRGGYGRDGYGRRGGGRGR
jgi:cold-inducible RNA-binding protein